MNLIWKQVIIHRKESVPQNNARFSLNAFIFTFIRFIYAYTFHVRSLADQDQDGGWRVKRVESLRVQNLRV